MCLSKISEKKIAEEDIVCYKIVHKFTDKHYRTVFQGMKIFLNTEYVDTTPKDDDSIGLTISEINGGYYHTFKDKNKALKYSQYFGAAACVLKGIIPKGSEYYEGVYISIYQGNLSAYASKKIKYIEEVDPYNYKSLMYES